MTGAALLYALFMALALAAALIVRRAMPRPAAVAGLTARERGTIALVAVVGGVLGARLPFVVVRGEGWLHDDGKTIMAGLAFGYLAVEICKPLLKIRAKTGDSFALPLAVAMAVGRWGCFFNGCCAGTPTHLPWGVDFGDGAARHPTQIYEVFFHLGMAGVLWLLIRRDLLRVQRLKLYIIAYALFRFAVEFLRIEPRWWLGLSVYQWAAVVMVAALAWQWAHDHRVHFAHGVAGGLPRAPAAGDAPRREGVSRVDPGERALPAPLGAAPADRKPLRH